MADNDGIDIIDVSALKFKTKSPRHNKYPVRNHYIDNYEDEDDNIIHFMREFNENLKSINTQFESAMDFYSNVYEKEIKRSRSIKEFDYSKFNELGTTKLLYSKYNELVDKTCSPEELKRLIENNKTREIEYVLNRNKVYDEMKSYEVSNIVNVMKQMSVLTNQLKESLSDTTNII